MSAREPGDDYAKLFKTDMPRIRLLEAFVAACDLDAADTTEATRKAVVKLRARIGEVDAEAQMAARMMVEGFK